MAKIYAKLIKKGKLLFENVPAELQEAVKELLGEV